MNGVFITGTGTDVGKTYITGGLLRAMITAGHNAVSMKPVQTGAARVNGEWRVPDLEAHREMAGLPPANDEQHWMAPYVYERPSSPHLAARDTWVFPEISHITACARKLSARYHWILIEGAGGVLVPLNERRNILDLIVRLALPVIVVSRTDLGTINHTLLTLQALRAARCKILGVVMNEVVPTPDWLKSDNADVIGQVGDVPLLAQVPHGPLSPKALANLLQPAGEAVIASAEK